MLDQQVARQLGHPASKISEIPADYRILGMVARRYCPDIDERSLLELASLSLSYLNCGEVFIEMLEEIAGQKYFYTGYILERKDSVSFMLAQRKDMLIETLDAIKTVFKPRKSLSTAIDHLCSSMLDIPEILTPLPGILTPLWVFGFQN